MFSVILMAAAAFTATNIDDIFLLTLLFSSGGKKSHIFIGHFIGIMLISLVSFMGAYGLAAFFEKYIFLLGLIPIILGIKAIFDKDDDKEISSAGGLFSVLLLVLSACGDNIGIYIPLFAGMGFFDFALCTAVFAAMSLLLCFTAQRLSSLPALGDFIDKYKRIIVPAVFIALGTGILTGGF